MNPRHIVVCGAGAAGLTAAIFASGEGSRVTLLERTDKAGKKILMSGGTRCNVLPVKATLDDYHTGSSKNILKKIFKTWPVEDCHQWFSSEIGLKMACEEVSNKWFPESNSAKEVRDLLLKKAIDCGVEISYKSSVEAIEPVSGKWRITLKEKQALTADAIIVATGGLSIPTTGTDGIGHRFLAEAGHTTGPVYPALTPLTTGTQAHKELSGISSEVLLKVRVNGKELAEANRAGFLFTHRGYSGPAVLDLSHFSRPEYLKQFGKGAKAAYSVNWTGESEAAWQSRMEGKQTVSNMLKSHLPRRLADLLAGESGLGDQKTAELARKDRNRLLEILVRYPLPAIGDEGYRKAEVTGGGVPLSEIIPATLESRIHSGLYLCGEIMDVFGRIGGFNFYWAWVSGRLAGLSAAKGSADIS